MKGADVVIKKGTVAAGTAIAAMRAVSVSFDSETVDITSADDTGRWRLLLAASGVKKMSVTLSGVLKDVTGHGTMITDALAQTIDAYGLVFATLGSFDGSYQLTSFEVSGEYNGEAQYSMTLESSGAIVYTTIA